MTREWERLRRAFLRSDMLHLRMAPEMLSRLHTSFQPFSFRATRHGRATLGEG